MKIPIQFKPELCVSKDASRHVLQNVMLDIHNNKTVAVATDGRKLVVVPVELEDCKEVGLVPPKALIAARANFKTKGGNKQKHGDVPVKMDDLTVTVKNGSKTVIFDRPVELGHFPKWEQVLPNTPVKHSIRFNVQFLYDLAKAMGSDVVTLDLYGNETPMRVTGLPNTEAFGFLMPCRI